MASTGPTFAHLTQTTHTAGKPPARHGEADELFADREELAICKQLGIPYERLVK